MVALQTFLAEYGHGEPQVHVVDLHDMPAVLAQLNVSPGPATYHVDDACDVVHLFDREEVQVVILHGLTNCMPATPLAGDIRRYRPVAGPRRINRRNDLRTRRRLRGICAHRRRGIQSTNRMGLESARGRVGQSRAIPTGGGGNRDEAFRAGARASPLDLY